MVLDLGVPVTLEKKKEKKCGSQNGGAAGVGSVVIDLISVCLAKLNCGGAILY